ncbi:hypothetical protein LFML04_0336 [Leptospirillum ferriphilum ML-04]|uniref:Uncharacterized protein n=1 Tax=Leptospirillum ferriphilum (strain ML-04) TaxID=1048260 RepID=J9Z9H0_LEPFM|nr:hypothetical protein LFML04_0336 [Leptospirillum ferriphilum ML-04]
MSKSLPFNQSVIFVFTTDPVVPVDRLLFVLSKVVRKALPLKKSFESTIPLCARNCPPFMSGSSL